jgi:hypothetical protein
MMSKKTAAAGQWPARPFDPKCRDVEPVDDAVVAQIRAVIAEWHPDDWPAVRAVLEVEVPNAAGRLATLTVRDVRLLFNSLAHRGHGQRHTAHTDVVTCAVPVPVPAGLAEDVAWYSANCADYTHGAILSTLLGFGSTNRSKAQTKADVGRAVGSVNKPADLSRPFEQLVDRGVVHALQGVGVWLSPRGAALAEHLAERKTPVGKVRLSPGR